MIQFYLKQLHRSFSFKAAVFIFFGFVFFNSNSAAQTIITGVPWTGEKGITLTVDQIMAQEKPVPFTHVRIRREHNAHLRRIKNIDAPEISSYPPNSTIDNRGGGGNSPAATQTIGASWRAVTLATSGGWIPPDCNGATGPSQVLTCANTRMQVYDKAGVLGPLNTDLNTFFNSVRNGSGISDTHIRYDRLSGRWFVVTINVAGSNNRVCIAVSSGPVIAGAGSFTFFQFQFNLVTTAGNNGQFFDYPTLGVDANALYIGGNCFGPGFTGSIIFVVRKSSILGAGPIVATAFRTVATAGSGIYTPQGVDNDDPAATEGYFVGTDAGVYSRLNFIRIGTPGGVPTATVLPFLNTPSTYDPIDQQSQGTATLLDGVDFRLFAAHVMKNKLTGVTTLWTAHNIRVNNAGVGINTGNRNACRWYQIGNMTGTPALVQSGTLYDGAGANYRGFWIPSIAMSGQGHAVLGGSTASPVNYADVMVAGRYSCDALGTLQPFALATASSTAYNLGGGTTRWGDYSQVVVDPNDNMTMWAFEEYCDAANDWAVRVVQLLAPPPPPTASLNPLANVGCHPSVPVSIVANSTPNCTGFFDPGPDVGGPGFANHITASVTGGITVNSITFIDATHVNLNLNTTVCVPGTYVITITNPDGQSTTINITIPPSALPVELISFTGQPSDKNILLKWTTASETNSDYFYVEKSKDAEQFEKIGKVKGAGNSNVVLNYSFIDDQPWPGISYYRLDQVDFNRAESYSKVISVEFGRNVFGLVGAYANYEDKIITIYFNDAGTEDVQYTITDALGKTVSYGLFTSSKGGNVIKVDGKKLDRGIYFLTVSNQRNTLTKKIFY